MYTFLQLHSLAYLANDLAEDKQSVNRILLLLLTTETTECQPYARYSSRVLGDEQDVSLPLAVSGPLKATDKEPAVKLKVMEAEQEQCAPCPRST